MPSIGVAQGAVADFRILQEWGENSADGQNWVCSSVASQGMMVHLAAQGICALVSGAMPATATYLGAIEQNVVADHSQPIDFGYKAQQQGATVGGVVVSGDVVSIWRRAQALMVAVSGTVTAGVLVYPQDGGKVGSVKIGVAEAIGFAITGNGGVAGDPFIMEWNLIGRQHA